MSVLKNGLLGSAAVLGAVSAAGAADLPSRKAAPVDYVRICDAQGSGFFFIPGSDTCLKIGGFARARYVWLQTGNVYTAPTFKASAAAPAAGNSTLIPSGVLDSTGFLGRGLMTMDARTQTAFGTARTFISMRFNSQAGLFADNIQSSSGLTGNAGSTAIALESAYVQFAGFSFGRVKPDIFFFTATNDALTQFDVHYFGTGVNMLSYTGVFGGGLSATIGIEDRAGFNGSVNPGYAPNAPGNALGVTTSMAAFAGNSAGLAGGAIVNGPLSWPVLAANIRYDQPWGTAQVMGEVLQNSATTTFAAGNGPNVTLTQTGWAIGAGLQIKLPMLAAGDEMTFAGAYSNGDLDAVNDFPTSATTVGRDFNGLVRIDRNMYVTPTAAAVAGTCVVGGFTTSGCFRTEQTTAWDIYGHIKHYWSPTIYSELLGSYLSITPGTVTQNTDWTLGGLSKANTWRIGHYLAWDPIKDFELGVEVAYYKLNAKLTGTNGAAPTPIPAALNGLTPNSSTWMVMGHVQRTF